jgi:dihydrodipicolinate synthase/N-acetylneuraminate lyase
MKGIVIKTTCFTQGTLIQHYKSTIEHSSLQIQIYNIKTGALWNDLESINKVNVIKWQST